VQSRILELGCGNGRTTVALSEKAGSLIALDFSLQACRLARKNAGAGERTDILAADARAIPIAAGSVDAVVAHHVAGHLLREDRLLLARESVRVLKPGGFFFFCDFSIEDFRCGSGKVVEDRTYRRGNGVITHYFSEDEVRSLSGQLSVMDLTTRRWPLRIFGRDYPRAELIASFIKT
jgi:ubiquinone/menaquinone biosynthesis C-methylase UbiE